MKKTLKTSRRSIRFDEVSLNKAVELNLDIAHICRAALEKVLADIKLKSGRLKQVGALPRAVK